MGSSFVGSHRTLSYCLGFRGHPSLPAISGRDKAVILGDAQSDRLRLRYFYRVCLEKTWMIEHIPYAKKPTKLPVVLSREEVFEFFDLVESVKHRTILMTLYGTGARISEALALQVQDVDSQRMLIHVRHGKGAGAFAE